MKINTAHGILTRFILALFLGGTLTSPVLGSQGDLQTVLGPPAVKQPAAADAFPMAPKPLQLAQNTGGGQTAGHVSSLTQVTTQAEDGGVSVTLESTGNLQYTAFKLQKPLRLVMDFPKTNQGVMKKKMKVGKSMVQSIRPLYFDEAQVLRLEFALSQPAAYEILRPQPNKLVIHFQQAPGEALAQARETAAPKTAGQPAGGRTGQTAADLLSKKGSTAISTDPCYFILGGNKPKVSLDFQNARLVNIFRILSEVGNFNLVLSPDVQGSTNVRLLNVPWNMALELIMKNNGLGNQCFDNIVRIAPQATIASEEDTRRQANDQKRRADFQARMAGDLVTQVVNVNYADIKSLSKNLTSIISERGRVTADDRTNTIIMTDIQDNVNDMVRVIESLDKPTPQVMIQARIVEVNRNARLDLGIQWGGQFQGTTGKDFPNTIEAGANSNNNPGFIVDLPNSALAAGSTAGIGITLGSLAKDVILDIQLQALEQQGMGRTLSSPRVTTLDNKQARIQSGRKIPYATVSQDGTRIQFVDASIDLTVTPHITADANILMQISARKNSANFEQTVAGVPSIDTKEAFTEVLVQDAETTVLGGLYENAITNNKTKVPFFAEIPFIGKLFQKFSDQDIVRELLIFITPTIVKTN